MAIEINGERFYTAAETDEQIKRAVAAEIARASMKVVKDEPEDKPLSIAEIQAEYLPDYSKPGVRKKVNRWIKDKLLRRDQYIETSIRGDKKVWRSAVEGILKGKKQKL